MSRLTLRLPETLHQQLISLAEDEGVSLNQFIVYALSKVSSNYSVRATTIEERQEQRQSFEKFLQNSRKASPEEIEAVLAEREIVDPEPELTPEIIARIRQKIRDAKS